jgi:hypothetical protein
MDKDEIKQFLYEHIKSSIKGDIKPLLKDKCGDEEIGGYFAVIVLVFTLIEYLGRLRYNNTGTKDGSKHATWWIRKYMGKCNKRYSKIGGVLFDMYRHGTVHTREPKQYLFTLTSGFAWEIVKNERQTEHLKIYKGRNFVISLNQLAEDLEFAIDYFWTDLKDSTAIEKKFVKAFLKLKTPQWVPSLKREKKYLKKDLEILEKELIPW